MLYAKVYSELNQQFLLLLKSTSRFEANKKYESKNGGSQKPATDHLLDKGNIRGTTSRSLIGSAHGRYDRKTPCRDTSALPAW